MNDLRYRELHHTVESVSTQSGLSHASAIERENFSGMYKHVAHLANGKYAFIENAKEFVLVSWRPSLEDLRGKVFANSCGPART